VCVGAAARAYNTNIIVIYWTVRISFFVLCPPTKVVGNRSFSITTLFEFMRFYTCVAISTATAVSYYTTLLCVYRIRVNERLLWVFTVCNKRSRALSVED